jgi:2'-5' RNA ligase
MMSLVDPENPAVPPARVTLLLIDIAEAAPLLEHWRRRFDPAASAGVPNHVTVLAPFLDEDLLDRDTLAKLRALIAAHDPMDVTFRRTGRFPGILYLAPEPAEPIRVLTEAIVARWPQCPPYGGAYGSEIVPHMTIGYDLTPEDEAELESDVLPRLPLAAHITEVVLLVAEGERWHRRESFPLGKA